MGLDSITDRGFEARTGPQGSVPELLDGERTARAKLEPQTILRVGGGRYGQQKEHEDWERLAGHNETP